MLCSAACACCPAKVCLGLKWISLLRLAISTIPDVEEALTWVAAFLSFPVCRTGDWQTSLSVAHSHLPGSSFAPVRLPPSTFASLPCLSLFSFIYCVSCLCGTYIICLFGVVSIQNGGNCRHVLLAGSRWTGMKTFSARVACVRQTCCLCVPRYNVPLLSMYASASHFSASVGCHVVCRIWHRRSIDCVDKYPAQVAFFCIPSCCVDQFSSTSCSSACSSRCWICICPLWGSKVLTHQRSTRNGRARVPFGGCHCSLFVSFCSVDMLEWFGLFKFE